MNGRQKLQVGLAVLFAVLFFIWVFLPYQNVYARILGLTGNALGFLAKVLGYKAEERNKKSPH